MGSFLTEAILTEPAAGIDDGESIILVDTRTQSGIRDEYEEGERSAFLPGDASDSEEEHEDGDAQISRIDISVRRGSHEDDVEEGEYEIVPGPGTGNGSGRSGRRRDRKNAPGTLSAKAGTIMGIHNIFIVIPQFLVTGFSAILFALFDPQKPSLPAHRGPVAPAPPAPTGAAGGNVTAAVVSAAAGVVERGLRWNTKELVGRAEMGAEMPSNTVVYIFRIGGVAASFAFFLCWRLSREIQKKWILKVEFSLYNLKGQRAAYRTAYRLKRGLVADAEDGRTPAQERRKPYPIACGRKSTSNSDASLPYRFDTIVLSLCNELNKKAC
ncbi:hypothetical protein CPB84DRAFT_1855355 [Gymnopilus junonius]|uniref:Rhodanese domain-containing protein n=1 Tax=Gymnopilus junonius TaxID=109634 RepID=A0A9P5N7T1_GYMJU|nr:hypothetical protein CPB84DRAFT_1855355 [Gymnopilus junonius]